MKLLTKSGFSLVEILMVIGLVGILSTISITMLEDNIEETRFDNTLEELKQIKKALIGDETSKESNQRMSYGYAGDIGNLPSNAQGIQALFTKPGPIANWSINSNYRLPTGWRGPYLVENITGTDLTKDAWGNNYIYNSTSNPATIQSLGADGAAGGTVFNSDITISIPSSQHRATVHGFISQGQGPYNSTAVVELYVPDGTGGVTTLTASVNIGDQGYFSFTDIPMGIRTIKMYAPNKLSPEHIIGPALINIDTNNYLIPKNTFDIPLPEGGINDDCASPAGLVSYRPGTGSLTATRIDFKVDITANLNIIEFAYDLVPDDAVLFFRIGGKTNERDCGTTAYMTPCPVMEGKVGVFNPVIQQNVGTNLIGRLDFATATAGTTSLSLRLTHDQGCEVLIINDF